MQNKLIATAIVASFRNEERTRAFQLQANGVLFEMERETVGDVWSPPTEVGRLANSIGSFEEYLSGLTSA